VGIEVILGKAVKNREFSQNLIGLERVYANQAQHPLHPNSSNILPVLTKIHIYNKIRLNSNLFPLVLIVKLINYSLGLKNMF